jgi:hypothetical protein
MTKGWEDIERHQGFAGAEARAAAELRPLLERVVLDPIDAGRQQKIITR